MRAATPCDDITSSSSSSATRYRIEVKNELDEQSAKGAQPHVTDKPPPSPPRPAAATTTVAAVASLKLVFLSFATL